MLKKICCALYCLHQNSSQWVQQFLGGSMASSCLSNYGNTKIFILYAHSAFLHEHCGIAHFQTKCSFLSDASYTSTLNLCLPNIWLHVIRINEIRI